MNLAVWRRPALRCRRRFEGMLADLTRQLSSGQHLSRAAMTDAVDAMMRGQAAHDEIAAFLLALRAKGETADEICGAALAMRQHMTPIRARRTGIVDTC